MNGLPENNVPAPIAAKKKRARKFRVALAALMVLALASFVLYLAGSSDAKMAWLTPAELDKASQPGLLLRLRYRVGTLLAPISRYVHRPHRKKPMIRFDSNIFTLPSASASQINLGAATSTNADGMHAWILSEPELASFNQQLRAMSNVASVSRPRIETADGVRCQMSVGNSILMGGSYVPVGLTVNLIPNAGQDLVKLLVGVTDTETAANTSSTSPAIKTNFVVACRATVPDAGALVIDGGQAGEKHYWLVLSPALLDANGKPIKPRP